MPICPGCEHRVPYDELRSHVEYCPEVNDGDEAALAAIEDLDHRLTDLERQLFRRLSRLEAEVEVSNMVSRTDDAGVDDHQSSQ